MQRFARRDVVLPLAIALVAMGAVVLLWQALRTDHERRVANVAEATSYATRSELARRLMVQLESLQTLADFWISTDEDLRRPDATAPLALIRFEGMDAIAWGADGGARFLVTSANPVAGHVPTADEWAPLASLVEEARAAPGPMVAGPFVDADGHATFRYYLPIERWGRSGALVAVIDAHDMLAALLVDEALGYAIRVVCCDGVELYRRGQPDAELPGTWARGGWIAPAEGIRWNVTHRPSAELSADLETSAVDSVLIVGLALAFLLGVLVFETRRANERATAANAAEARIRKLHRELEGRVMARTQKLDDVLRDLNTINLAVSHDLRSPLNAISLVTGQLQDTNRDEATARRLEKIGGGVARMTQMLDRLLGYARASAFASERVDVDMRSLAERVVEEQSLDARDVTIGALPAARVDPVITHILLSNLVANAVRHGRGSRGLRLEIGSTAGDDGVPVYYVRDDGPGLDPQLAEQLFRPLAERPKAEGKSGLGLGLAIAARAVEAHGGRIWVDSVPGRGTTFSFTLRPPPNAAVAADDAD
jgi:signal transduction histidine kinase